MALSDSLQYLLPDADPLRDYVLQDDGDGPYIAEWNLPSSQPTSEELAAAEPEALKSKAKRELTKAAQRHLDQSAQQRGYDDIHTCRINAGSGHTKYGPEGQACQTLYGSVWDKCWEVFADVDSDARAIPTEDELIAELPVIVWPA